MLAEQKERYCELVHTAPKFILKSALGGQGGHQARLWLCRTAELRHNFIPMLSFRGGPNGSAQGAAR
jgi:hypothetical protein